MVTANFQATTSDDAILAQWWVEIEGIRLRYGSHVPSWAPADSGTNRAIKSYFEELPTFQGQKAEPLDGSTDPYSFTVRLLDVDDELTELFSVHDDTCGIARLTVAATKAAGTITVDDASVFTFPCDIFVDRETMRCTNIVGNVLTVTRGMYGSEAVAHPITDSQGNDLYIEVRDKPSFMLSREVALCECRVGLAEVDAIKVRGYLSNYKEDDGVWILQCSGFLRLLSQRIGETLAETTLIHNLWGGPHPDSDDSLLPRTGVTTWAMMVADESKFESEGHVIVDQEIMRYVSKCSSSGLSDEHGPLLKFIGKDEDYIFTDNSPCVAGRGCFSFDIFGEHGLREKTVTEEGGVRGTYQFPYFMKEHLKGTQVRQVIHSDDFGTPLTAARVILVLLTSTGDGTNGTYDLLPAGWGAGIPVSKIDSTEIAEICALSGGGRFDPFCITEPLDMREWLEENILRPLHLFFVETPDGKISVRRLWSKNEALCYTTPTTIDHDVLFEIPKLKPDKPPIGEIKIKMNWYPGEDKFYGNVNVILGDGREKYKNMSRNYEIEIKTVYDPRVTLGGALWRSGVPGDLPDLLGTYLGPIWENFSLKPCPEIEFEVPYNRWIDVTVGQVCVVTCSVSPDLKGSKRGMTSAYFQVVEATPDPERSSVKCVAWMIGVHDEDTRRLAPSAKVKSYVDPSPRGAPAVRVNLEDAEFADGLAGYDYDVDGFEVGDEIMIIDAQYRPLAGAVPEEATIDAKGNGVGTCWVDLTAAPANPPGPGDYIDTARYDSCTANQKAKWAYLADANAELGAANDPAHKRDR